MAKNLTLTFTETELDQLMFYTKAYEYNGEVYEYNGEYYGNLKQFNTQHERIRKKIQDALDSLGTNSGTLD